MTFKVEVNYVEVDARVLDGAGNFIRDLRKEDFQLFEDGKPSEMTTGLLKFCEDFELAAQKTNAFVNELNEAKLLIDGEIDLPQSLRDRLAIGEVSLLIRHLKAPTKTRRLEAQVVFIVSSRLRGCVFADLCYSAESVAAPISGSRPVESPNFSIRTPIRSSSVRCRLASGVPFGKRT